jgi:hypothetical protein
MDLHAPHSYRVGQTLATSRRYTTAQEAARAWEHAGCKDVIYRLIRAHLPEYVIAYAPRLDDGDKVRMRAALELKPLTEIKT